MLLRTSRLLSSSQQSLLLWPNKDVEKFAPPAQEHATQTVNLNTINIRLAAMVILVVALAEAEVEVCDRIVCTNEHGDKVLRMQCVCNAIFGSRTHRKK